VSDNPYAPPKAVVVDPTDLVSVAARPQAVTLATHLLWSAFALGALNSAIVGSLSTLAVSVLILGLLGLLTHKISRGRNWARITLLVLVLLGLPGALADVRSLLEQPLLVAAISVVISGLQIVALYLVFTGDGARWFRRGKDLQ
jgi:hypothetical protein